ncbi:phosphoglycerate mutase-like protein [Serendipita vermifera]|nr:phosphoglycerate mutase-like protein [Serendipita vermifera]
MRNLAALTAAYLAGAVSVILLRWLLPDSCAAVASQRPEFPYRHPWDPLYRVATPSFPGDIGSTVAHEYPPTSPTNAIPSMFPTEVGYAGPTVTGAEPAIIATATAYPPWDGTAGLIKPDTWGKSADEDDIRELPSWIEDAPFSKKEKFNIFHNWGNLSPFHSVPRDAFGAKLSSSPSVPPACKLRAAHILHRHGARYPTGWSGEGSTSALAASLHNAAQNGHLKARDGLNFLNKWTYKLGSEVLTPFGRQQLFDLGVSMRMKYGKLLEGFKDRLPVFRTESQDRMLTSATNFALGFFGWPLDNKFLLSVTIEADGFNNTLVPDKVCPNFGKPTVGARSRYYIQRWVAIYLKAAHKRIQAMLEGYELTLADVYSMQSMCAYETVALGSSEFCALFTEEEWEGFDYSIDLLFWYDSGFGSPVARALGSGYVLELLSRLTKKPIGPSPSPLHKTTPLINNPSTFSVNLTLDSDPITFPLDNDLYVDATHDTIIANVVTALNLTVLGKEGPPSYKKMKRGRAWRTSRISPFASNMQIQILDCTGPNLIWDPHAPSYTSQIRVILNDAIVPLTGVEGCPDQRDGLCPTEKFIKAQKKLLEAVDWDWACHGDWSIPEGDAWQTTTGNPPSKEV